MTLQRLSVAFLALIIMAACSDSSTTMSTDQPTNSASPSRTADFDLIIRNGTVIDGSGAARIRADIGIKGDAIAAIDDLADRTATESIDASNLIVAPGFIDLLGQSQRSVLIDPKLEGKIRQGVTTEVTGEGHSPAPLSEAMAAQQTKEDPEIPRTWRTLDDFMRVIEKRGSALNFAFYIGASNPRSMVLGEVNRDPTEAEFKQMEAIVDEAMRDGAVGISTSLIYVPAIYSTPEEIIRLTRIAGKYGAGYFTHMRNEGSAIEAALDETFRIGREADVPVNIFHLKVGGRSNWGEMPAIVARIEKERKSGRDVAANVYPYDAAATSLTSVVPDWALEGGYPAFVARLRQPAERKRIASEMAASGFEQRVRGPKGLVVTRIPNPSLAQFEKKRLPEIAKRMGTSEIEAALRLFEESAYSPTAIFFAMSEEDVKYALKQPWVSVGCDSGAIVGKMREQGAHPRAYGSFPRVVGRYVRDEKLFTLEEAIRKVTSLAASRVLLRDRGLLKVGMKADIVVFDEMKIEDRSTYQDPHQFSVGISHVLVNGKFVLRDETMTGQLPGRVLRGPGYRAATTSASTGRP